jgi:glycerol-3-phosphate dehydrogenase (NAD(P)+)
MWAFWFAIAHHLSRVHPEEVWYAYERNPTITDALRETRKHPYFFEGVALSPHVTLIDDPKDVLSLVDTIIIALPVPYIRAAIESLSPDIREDTLFVNCSKGIENTTLSTVSDILSSILTEKPYHYSALSGGMIASELVDGAPLWATIGISDRVDPERLKTLFEGHGLDISIVSSYRNVELFGSLKNIFALMVWYLEGKWYGLSTVGHTLTLLYRELPELLVLLGGSKERDFADFALGGDLIATCFGESRNRYLWRLVGSGKSPSEALEILRNENKHAEWYETLKLLLPLIREHHLRSFERVGDIFFPL